MAFLGGGGGGEGRDLTIGKGGRVRLTNLTRNVLMAFFSRWHLGFCNWKYTPTYRGFDSFYGYYNGAEDYYTRIRGKLSYQAFDTSTPATASCTRLHSHQR